MSSKVLLVGSQHGNELLGEKLYAYIKKHMPDCLGSIDYLLANPKARAKRIRFTETDMNRSYVTHPTSYEEKRAEAVVQHITASQPTIVLDLHTTTCIQEPCFIVASITPQNRRFLGSSQIPKIVLMHHDMAKQSLIGQFDNAISIEVSVHDVTQVLPELARDIQRFLNGTQPYTEKQLFAASDLLLKSEITIREAGKLVNFQKSTHGFYPVLVGENSYKKNTDYLGFKATSRKTIKL